MIKSDEISIKLSKNNPLSYTVYFVDDLFNPSTKSSLQTLCKDKKILIVIDKKVFNLHGRIIEKYFKLFNKQYEFFQLEALEQNKTMETVLKICQFAKNYQMRRDSVFIGIGGGITLDIVGFAASMFRRKTKYIRIPTTLVGQVDAGVGIKVGVNFDNSKNLLGGYYPPVATLNDQVFLKTLDVPNIRNGLFEMVKMGLIDNKALFCMLEKYHKSFLNREFNLNTDKMIYLSTLSMMKELDPNLYEHNLKRSVDFGHTFSLYIEESSNYSISHGEAVGIDIFISSFISLKRKVFTQEVFNRVLALIDSIGFTKKYTFTSAKGLYNSLQLVRNHRAGNLNLAIPSGIGRCVFVNECGIDELQNAIDFYNNHVVINS